MKPFMTRTAMQADRGWTYHATTKDRAGRSWPMTGTAETFGGLIVGTVFPFFMNIFQDGHPKHDLPWWVKDPDGRMVVRANIPPLPPRDRQTKGYALLLKAWEPGGNSYGLPPLALRFNHLDPALEGALGAMQVAHILRGTFAQATIRALTAIRPGLDVCDTSGFTVLEAEGFFPLASNVPEHVTDHTFFPPDRWEALTGPTSQKETRRNERSR